MNFTEFCIRRPVFTIVLSLIIIVLGVIGFLRVPVRGYPRVNPPVITIYTYYNGASASVMESQVTTQIENDVVGTPGLQEMHSSSRSSRSYVVLKYELGVNIDEAVSDVRNRLAKIMRRLPQGAEQPVIQKRDPNSLQLMIVSVTDPLMSQMELTDYINRQITPSLEQVLGVANIELYNSRDYAMKIRLNPSKMAANQVTVNDMTRVLEQQNMNVPTGQIKTQDRYYSVLNEGQLATQQAFKNLIIRDDNGYLLRFRDVAKVRVEPENLDSAMRINGTSAIGISIYGLSTANPMKVVTSLQKRLKELRERLPEKMTLDVVWNGTTYLKATLEQVYHDLGFAIILVVIVISLFLGSIRSALIPIVTIPICLVAACALIYMLNYSINIFTLLALVLAIGLVVDDAIVMLENIYRHLESGMSALQAAITGSREMVFAIIAMTLTLAAVYAPIGFSTGLTGVIFRQFAFTLALTVIVSGFVALTLSPMMCAKLLKHNKETFLDRLFHRLMHAYRCILQCIFHYRALVLTILAIFIVLGYFCYQSLPTTLEPKEDTGAFMVRIEPPSNASFGYIDRYAKEIEKELQALPGVAHVMMMTDDEDGFAFVVLKPWAQRVYTSEELMHRFTQSASSIAGVTVNAFNMSQLGGGGKYGDAVRLSVLTNNDYKSLFKVVNDFTTDLEQNPGFKRVTSDLSMNNQEYVVHINRNLAAALKVNLADVSNTLRTMLGGAKVTVFEWNNKNYDVILQVPQSKLDQLKVVNELYVRSDHNKMIPLSSLATISTDVGPQSLPHVDRMRADTITIQLAKNYSMGQAIDYIKHGAKRFLPDGYNIQFKGVAKNLLKSHNTMLWAFGLAVIFIYLVLSAQFESFRDPFIILLTVPFSMIGALFVLWLTGNNLSIYTNIGFVTLMGLIAKHGILITEFANQKRAEGKSLIEAVIDAAALRLRPILMTTAAMVIGAIPLVIGHGAGAIGRAHIGWVIVGGLLFGTFFSLVVVPVAYSFLSNKTCKQHAN